MGCLTRDLESKVAAGSAELNVMGSIVTSSTDAVVGISLKGLIVSWNPAAEALYGHRAEDVVGRRPEFLSAAQLEGMTHLLESAKRGRKLQNYQIDWTREDGTVVPVDMTISPILDGNVVVGISIFGQDITERRRAAEVLEAAREEALESSRLKSEFLATMSHEIRTPMNGVIGLTDLLLETSLDGVQRQYAEGVHGAGASLLTLINDILDFSKLEAGRVDLEVVDFDPRRLVEEVGTLLAPTAFAKELELLAYCLPGVPHTLRGDAARIRQILLNLVSNAVKFTSVGEVAVKVRCSPPADGRVMMRFEVSDTGIGIAEQDRQHLFESFSQADASTTRRYGGTGLGLAISLRLVEAMGGVIDMTSTVGEGSTFWFEIPTPVGTRAPDDLSVFSHDLLPGMRVLVVDDNATNRLILASQLTSWRLQPDVVEDAASALAQLRRRTAENRPYDIAILDMCMPGTDGLQLAQAISLDPTLQNTAMILLTSTQQVNTAALRQAGVREWLTKPVRNSELYDRLMRLMAPDQSIPAPDSVERGPFPAAGSSGRVLVAEDNSLNQLVAERVVSRLGYRVDIVTNGVEALEAVANATYSALLMDCHMPVMDGFEATRKIRRREEAGERIPIIAMTAGAMPEDRERCLAAGMDDYVSKPIDFRALETILARCISRAQSPASPPVAPTLTDEAVEVPLTPRAPAIDPERLEVLRALGSLGHSDLVTRLAVIFARDGASILAELREAAQMHAPADFGAAAHKLRGASGNIGADSVALLCHELESSADSLGSGQTKELLDQLEIELCRANRALEVIGHQAG